MSKHPRVPSVAIYALVVANLGFALACAVWANVAPTAHFGTTSQVRLGGSSTGVWRLAVATKKTLPFEHVPTAEIRTDGPEVPPSSDQVRSATDGWTAACETLRSFDLDPPEAYRCRGGKRPAGAFESRSTGSSAGLAEALGAFSYLTGAPGSLKVAATGELYPRYGEVEGAGLPLGVYEIAGVPDKAAAVRALGADLVFVPAANAEEFRAQLEGTGTYVVGVRTVTEAVLELCATTAACHLPV